MPYAGFFCGRIGRLIAMVVIGLVLVGGVLQQADAQTFEFTPTGGFLSGSTIFSTLTITATATSNSFAGVSSLAQYNITDIAGTFNGNLITGLLAAPGANVGGRSVNNAAFTNLAGFAGNVFLGRDDANSHLSQGFGFTTSAGNFLVCADGSDCNLANSQSSAILRVYDSSGVIAGSTGGFTSVQVPGPLAGAGMLSWLSVMGMGLVWRRQQLLGRMRDWLAAIRQGKAQAA